MQALLKILINHQDLQVISHRHVLPVVVLYGALVTSKFAPPSIREIG